MIKSVKSWFLTFPVHPLSPKTHLIACLQTLKVLFFSLQTSSEISSDVIKIKFTVTYLEIFQGNAIAWAAVKTYIQFLKMMDTWVCKKVF